MTKELLKEIVTKNKMYVEWKTTGYDKIVQKDIKEAKRIYFNKIFTTYRTNMKKT